MAKTSVNKLKDMKRQDGGYNRRGDIFRKKIPTEVKRLLEVPYLVPINIWNTMSDAQKLELKALQKMDGLVIENTLESFFGEEVEEYYVNELHN